MSIISYFKRKSKIRKIYKIISNIPDKSRVYIYDNEELFKSNNVLDSEMSDLIKISLHGLQIVSNKDIDVDYIMNEIDVNSNIDRITGYNSILIINNIDRLIDNSRRKETNKHIEDTIDLIESRVTKQEEYKGFIVLSIINGEEK